MSIIPASLLQPSICSFFLKQLTESSSQLSHLCKTSFIVCPNPPVPPPKDKPAPAHQCTIPREQGLSTRAAQTPALGEQCPLPQRLVSPGPGPSSLLINKSTSFLYTPNPPHLGVVAVLAIVNSDILQSYILAFLMIWLTTLYLINNSLYSSPSAEVSGLIFQQTQLWNRNLINRTSSVPNSKILTQIISRIYFHLHN